MKPFYTISMNRFFVAHQGNKKTYPKLPDLILAWNGEINCSIRADLPKLSETKSLNQNRLGNFSPPRLGKWEDISMEFIIDLPKTKDGVTAILVVADKPCKGAQFIVLESETNAKHIAEVFYNDFTRMKVFQGRLLPIGILCVIDRSGKD